MHEDKDLQGKLKCQKRGSESVEKIGVVEIHGILYNKQYKLECGEV